MAGKKFKELKTTLETVKYILETYPETRDSDNKLYVRVCEYINFAAMHRPFCEVMTSLAEYGLPGFETVRRTRQKVQQENPHLASSRAIMAARSDNEEAFRAFARGEAG